MILTRFQLKSVLLGAAAIVASTVFASSAQAETLVYQLFNHPDGNAAPPQYGLRLDNLFGGGNTVHFSFDPADGASVFLTVTDSGGTITINIAGTVFGGHDNGGATYAAANAGFWDLDFSYTLYVAGDGTNGWSVSPQSNTNQGSLTALDNGGGVGGLWDFGASFDFFEQVGTNNPFIFAPDDHRLLTSTGGSMDYPEAGDTFVGRGWLSYDSSGSGVSDTQDWLFIGQLVPLPPAAWMAGIGLIGIAALRRRIL